MKYEVYAVPATAITADPRRDHAEETKFRSAPDIANDIRINYQVAHDWGGRVIASYTMTCAPESKSGEDIENVDAARGEPSECIFVVMELPDDYVEREEAEVRAAQAARAAAGASTAT
jgi:hypothetical protein